MPEEATKANNSSESFTTSRVHLIGSHAPRERKVILTSGNTYNFNLEVASTMVDKESDSVFFLTAKYLNSVAEEAAKDWGVLHDPIDVEGSQVFDRLFNSLEKCWATRLKSLPADGFRWATDADPASINQDVTEAWKWIRVKYETPTSDKTVLVTWSLFPAVPKL